jgi:predicted RNA-binding Zn ribbon-like protein
VPTKHFVYNDTANGAPGRLELVRAFLNSVDLEAVADGRAQDRLPDWCRESGLAPNADAEERSQLASFREALRAVTEANGGHGAAKAAWAGLDPFARRARYTLRAGEGGLDLAPAGGEAAMAAILAIVYQAQLDGTWPRLKVCRKQSCRWAFYDRSKNGSGAWCSMAVCGNRAKAARRRAREIPE